MRKSRAKATAVDDEQMVELGWRGAAAKIPALGSSHQMPSSHRSFSRSSPRPVVRFIVPEFVTAPGQVLALVGSGPALGNWDASRAVRLSWKEGHRWVATVQLEAGWHGALEFKLALIDGACAVWEPGSNRFLVVDQQPSSGSHPLEVTCVWGACAGRPPVPAMVQMQQGDDMAECTVVVPQPASLPGLRPGGRLVLTGPTPQLGEWDPLQGLVLTRQPASRLAGFAVTSAASSSVAVSGAAPGAVEAEEQVWMATARLPLNKLIEAKVVVVTNGHPLEWEAGPNRSILLSPPSGAYIKQADIAVLSADADAARYSPVVSHDDLLDALAATTAAAEGAASASSSARNGRGSGRNSSPSRPDRSRRSSNRVRGGRGRGYTINDSNADLARLLGVVDSDDEDSAYDEDGRPRGAANSLAAHGSAAAGGAAGEEEDLSVADSMRNNILAYNAAGGLVLGGSAARPGDSDCSDGSDSDGGGGSDPDELLSSPSIRVVSQAIVAPAAALGASATAAADASAASASLAGLSAKANAESTSGGDFVVLLHWGSTSCSQAVYRPLVQLQQHGEGPHGLAISMKAPTATAAVHFVVPQLATQPGQHLVITGSPPQLGSWDPSKGLRLKWGPGHRWTGHIDLPLQPTDIKVLICCDFGLPAWEPGSNRHVDLAQLVAANSPTGAADVHLTCAWGTGPSTAVLCVPKDAPAASAEGRDSLAAAAELVPLAAPGEAASELGYYDQTLVRMLTLLLSSAVTTREDEAAGLWLDGDLPASEQRQLDLRREAEEAREREQLLSRLQLSVASKQREVVELLERLAEARMAADATEGRLRLLEAAAEVAQVEAMTVRAAAAETVSVAHASVVSSQGRLVAEVSASRTEYKGRILNVQRQYEARILDLQQHETRILNLQQQHSQDLSGMETRHGRQMDDSLATIRRLEHQLKDNQLRMQQVVKQHEMELREIQKQQHAAVLELSRQSTEEAAVMQRRHVAELSLLTTSTQAAELKARTDLSSLEAQHKELIQRLSARHDQEIADVVMRLTAAEKDAQASSEVDKAQNLRRINELEASLSDLQRCGLELAQSFEARQAEAGLMKEQLVRTEASRAGIAEERDKLKVRVRALEADLLAERQQQKRQAGPLWARQQIRASWPWGGSGKDEVPPPPPPPPPGA